MAITNYTELQDAVGGWLNRGDLTARIPDFIALFEAQASRRLRVRDTKKRATATLSGQRIALPTDYEQMIGVQLNTDPVTPLQFASVNELDQIRRRHPAAARPLAYCVEGSEIEVAPAPDTSYEIEIDYYGRITPLSVAAPTNWLLTKHPDLYLYGTLLQAEPFLKNDERIPVWGGAVRDIFERIELADERAKTGGTPLKMRFRPYF